jgi:hypothetical protein
LVVGWSRRDRCPSGAADQRANAFSKFVLGGEAKEAQDKSATTLDFVEGWYYPLIDEQKSSILYRLYFVSVVAQGW